MIITCGFSYLVSVPVRFVCAAAENLVIIVVQA